MPARVLTIHALARLLAGVILGAAGCATQPPPPAPLLRLDPAEAARIDAARGTLRPLALDQIVALSRAGTPAAELVARIRATGTHHAIAPPEAERLRAQGVAPEVVEALNEAQARWAQDQAAAERVRRDTEAAAAADRARAEAERARLRAAPPYYYDPLWPYGYPYGSPYRYGYPGVHFGWGAGVHRWR